MRLIKNDDPARCPNCGRQKRGWRAYPVDDETPSVLCSTCDRAMITAALRCYGKKERDGQV